MGLLAVTARRGEQRLRRAPPPAAVVCRAVIASVMGWGERLW
jgi:hypothetical protein